MQHRRFQRRIPVPGSCAFRDVLRLHRGRHRLFAGFGHAILHFVAAAPSDNGLERAFSEPDKIRDGFEELNEVSKPAPRPRNSVKSWGWVWRRLLAKLYNAEVRLLARADTTSIEQLQRQKVNIDQPGSGTNYSMRDICKNLNLKVEKSHPASGRSHRGHEASSD